MKFYRVTGHQDDREKTPITRTIVAESREDALAQVAGLPIEDAKLKTFAPNAIQEKLANTAMPVLESYRTDLGIDVECLDTCKSAFLWFVRTNGTHLWRPISFASNPTTKDAVESLTTGRIFGPGPLHCFVGCAEPPTLKAITPERAREIATLWTRDERLAVRELPWKPKDDLPRAAEIVKARHILNLAESPPVREAVIGYAIQWGLDNPGLPYPAIYQRVDGYVRDCMAY